MRRYLFLLFVVLWLMVPAYALPEELLDALPGEARLMLEDAEGETPQDTMAGGFSVLRERGAALLGEAVDNATGPAVLVMGAAVLCAAAESLYRGADNEKVADFVPLVGVLTVTATTATGLHSMVDLGRETIEQLHVFAQALLPTLAAAVSSSGGLLTATVHQVATVWLSGMLITLVDRVLLSLVYAYIALSAAHAMNASDRLKPMAETIKKGITYLLSGVLVLFTGYLTLTGAMAESGDALTASLTRSAISAAVPVVGGIISEASSSVLAGATVLKNAVGVGGMLGVVSVCLSPFLTLGVQYLLFQLAAFFADILGTTLSEYIHALGAAFGLVLGMVGACALVLLVSVGSSVSVVIP